MEGGCQRRAVPRHICLKSSLLPQLSWRCSPEPPSAVFSLRLMLLFVGATQAEVFDRFAHAPLPRGNAASFLHVVSIKYLFCHITKEN